MKVTKKHNSIEILEFARKNSLISEHLDTVLEACKNANMHIGAESFQRYIYIKPEVINYIGKSNIARIDHNQHVTLYTEYTKRDNEVVDELHYLHRYFNAQEVEGAPVKCIAVILYSREQLKEEGLEIEAEWGLVTAQAEPEEFVSPMTPVTILRNALGKEFGGNGVPINREYYDHAVLFWNEWAIVK